MRRTIAVRAVIRRALISLARYAAQRLLGPHGDAYVTLAVEQFESARKKRPASQQ